MLVCMSSAEGTGTFSQRRDFFCRHNHRNTQRSLSCSGVRFYDPVHLIHPLTFLLRDCCQEIPNTTLFRVFFSFFSELVGGFHLHFVSRQHFSAAHITYRISKILTMFFFFSFSGEFNNNKK